MSADRPLDPALAAALDYLPRWLGYQVTSSGQPGCAVAIACDGRVVFERAFGAANLATDEALTPRHRFRVASHSKTFTAAGILRLREMDALRLDDPVGEHVDGLHRDVAAVTIAQLLSHSGGLVRDGADNGQFLDRRPFLDEAELRAGLKAPPILPAGTEFKYSNHGFGLLGLVIEAITGEPYAAWIQREVVRAAGLRETTPDYDPSIRGRLAAGHSLEQPLGRRMIIPGRNSTRAMAAATGFVSTARDLAMFFGQLDPAAPRSFLSVASRREMTRHQWHDRHSSLDRHYGLGLIAGRLGALDWFGHSGSFQGTLSRTAVVPALGMTVSVLANAIDGPSQAWTDGIIQVVRTLRLHGAPTRRSAGWTGRWWTLWNAVDLVPARDKVLVATPALFNPFLDAAEIAITGANKGRIERASGFVAVGEPARLVRGAGGAPGALLLGGARLVKTAAMRRELRARYRPARGAARPVVD
ncbi:MAG: beta-lactamase family protein [Alphaproteobacteria bacterium]|nr:beta-lactamase family protein [Alphaproteobacteria bacterium]